MLVIAEGAEDSSSSKDSVFRERLCVVVEQAGREDTGFVPAFLLQQEVTPRPRPETLLSCLQNKKHPLSSVLQRGTRLEFPFPRRPQTHR